MDKEYLFLASEKQELEKILQSLNPSKAIQRMTLEDRLASVNSKIEAYQKKNVKKAVLTFRGDPVVGSKGIYADFASEAMSVFSDVYAAVVAGLKGTLSNSGPITDKASNNILITGTAVGSFGFEFELPKQQNKQKELFSGKDIHDESIEFIQKLFNLSDKTPDDDVAEIVASVPQRTIRTFNNFLDLLEKYKAWCGLAFEGKTFQYENLEQVGNSIRRLRFENIYEDDKDFTGIITGILPGFRELQFDVEGTDDIIRCKIGGAIDPGELEKEWSKKMVTLTLNIVKVGNGRRRYTLNGLDRVKLARADC